MLKTSLNYYAAAAEERAPCSSKSLQNLMQNPLVRAIYHTGSLERRSRSSTSYFLPVRSFASWSSATITQTFHSFSLSCDSRRCWSCARPTARLDSDFAATGADRNRGPPGACACDLPTYPPSPACASQLAPPSLPCVCSPAGH